MPVDRQKIREQIKQDERDNRLEEFRQEIDKLLI